MAFTGNLLLAPQFKAKDRPATKDGRQSWLTAAAFGWDDIEVPVGSATDLASIPRLVWPLFPPDGPWMEAAVIHDYLYRSHGINGKYTRAQSDKVLLAAMTELGIPWYERYTIYSAVRAFGFMGWGS